MASDSSNNYVMGSHSTELDRIEGMHESTVAYTGQLFCAPADFTKPGLRVLDSGTAGGRWLVDLKKQNAAGGHHYIGTDLTESFFRSAPESDGIVLQVQDITKPWPQDWAASFDLVHQRFVLGGVGKQDLKDTVLKLVGLVKPGGWLELKESDVSEAVIADKANGAAQAWRLLRHLYTAMGVEPDVMGHLRGWLEEAGLVDIQEQRIAIPVGLRREDKTMGRHSAHTVVVTTRHLAAGAKMVRIPGYTDEDLDALPGNVEELLKTQGGSYSVYTIWARKP